MKDFFGCESCEITSEKGLRGFDSLGQFSFHCFGQNLVTECCIWSWPHHLCCKTTAFFTSLFTVIRSTTALLGSWNWPTSRVRQRIKVINVCFLRKCHTTETKICRACSQQLTIKKNSPSRQFLEVPLIGFNIYYSNKAVINSEFYSHRRNAIISKILAWSLIGNRSDFRF